MSSYIRKLKRDVNQAQTGTRKFPRPIARPTPRPYTPARELSWFRKLFKH